MLHERSSAVILAQAGTTEGRRPVSATASLEIEHASCQNRLEVCVGVDSGESFGYLSTPDLSQTIGAGRRFGSDREHA